MMNLEQFVSMMFGTAGASNKAKPVQTGGHRARGYKITDTDRIAMALAARRRRERAAKRYISHCRCLLYNPCLQVAKVEEMERYIGSAPVNP